MACSAFFLSVSLVWGGERKGREENGFAQLCSWKVCPVETGTPLSFYCPWSALENRVVVNEDYGLELRSAGSAAGLFMSLASFSVPPLGICMF